MEQKTQIDKKSSDLNPGYVCISYNPMTTSQCTERYGSKNTSRKRKIYKIFNFYQVNQLLQDTRVFR